MATSLGIYYIQIPYKFWVDPQGNVVKPKLHKGYEFIWVNRKRKYESSIPKLDYKAAMRFKEIFCER